MPGEHSISGRDTAPFSWWARAASWLAVLVGLLPVDVLACPACSVRAPESPVRSALLLGGLVLAPFLLVGVGLWAVRRVARDEAEERV